MARQFPRFLFSNPQNTKSKGPFIVHTMDPITVLKVSIKEPDAFFLARQNPYLTDDEFVYEVVMSKAETNREALQVTSFGIDWFQSQEEYKTAFHEWFYNLLDDNGAFAYTSYYKFKIGQIVVAYGYLYEIQEEENDMIHAIRRRVANKEDYIQYPVIVE